MSNTAITQSSLLGIGPGMSNPMTTAGDIITATTGGTPTRLAMGSGLQVLRVNSGATALEYATPSAGITYAIFTHTSSGAGGTATAGSWETRTLNTTIHNGINGCSLSNNQITLPAGDYLINASGVFFETKNSQLRLYNVTTATDVAASAIMNATQNSLIVVTASLVAKATLLAENVLRLENRVEYGASVNGYGLASQSWSTIQHARIEIIKL